MTQVVAAVIHRLIKDRHGPAEVSCRDELLALNEPVLALVGEIQKLYFDKANKGLGRFDPDEINYPAAAVLRRYFNADEMDFLQASSTLMATLASKAAQVPLATGGFVLMAHVRDEADTNWFIVAIATNVRSTAVNEDTYDVVKSIHVDLQNLRIAGRVNASEWLEDKPDSRYVGFLKQRGGLSDYFRLFLGCNEVLHSGPETRKMLNVLETFATDQKLDEAGRETLLKAAYDYGIKCESTQTPLSLDTLCHQAWPEEPETLKKAFANSEVAIADGFVPDKKALRGFIRYKGKTKFWNIDIAREAFSNGYAQYDPKTRTLVLSNLPDALETDLIRDTVEEDGRVQ